MAALRPTFPEHRPYTQAEQDSGLLPRNDQLWESGEINNVRDVLNGHADDIDRLGESSKVSKLSGVADGPVLSITHDLGRDEYSTDVEEVSTGEIVLVQVIKLPNSVIVGPFDETPTLNQYRIITG